MTSEDAYRSIESAEFSASVSIASRFSTFLHAASAEPAVVWLSESIQEEDRLRDLSLHVVIVIARPFDPQYENPWDSALAVYLWMIYQTRPVFGTRFITMVLKKAMRKNVSLFWVTKTAHYISVTNKQRQETEQG